ncbi:MAG TPA: hypothetical protein VLL05_21665 [Terriglobales bacterium]|nr:hypothetical protein [Terriglobales bacterium]
MDSQEFSEWLAMLTVPGRVTALTRIYLRLTINAREVFVPDWVAGKAQRVLEILHGLNEIHHTLANQLAAYATDEHKAYPVQALSQMLLEIERKYRLENFLTSALEFVRTQKAMVPLTVYPDGTVADGKSRIMVLKDRGVDVDSLPRVERKPGI